MKKLFFFAAMMLLGLLTGSSVTAQRIVTISGADFGNCCAYRVVPKVGEGVEVIGRQNYANTGGNIASCVVGNGNNNTIDMSDNRRRIEIQLDEEHEHEKITKVVITYRTNTTNSYVCVVHTESKTEPINSYGASDYHVYKLLNGGYNVTNAISNTDNCLAPDVFLYNAPGQNVRKIIIAKGVRWKDDIDGQFAGFDSNNLTGFDNATYTSGGGSFLSQIELTIETPSCDQNPPADLTETANTANSVSLSWTAEPGADYYNIYYSTTSGGTYYKANSAPIYGTTYTHEGLSPNTTYYYKATAYSDTEECESDKSAEESASTCDIAQANAGADVPSTPVESPVTLDATAADTGAGDTGEWSVISAPEAVTLSDDTDPNATFTPNLKGNYILRWTITNSASTCSSFADVKITVTAFCIEENFTNLTIDDTSFTSGLLTGTGTATISKVTPGNPSPVSGGAALQINGSSNAVNYLSIDAPALADTLIFWAYITNGAVNDGSQNAGLRVYINDIPATEVYGTTNPSSDFKGNPLNFGASGDATPYFISTGSGLGAYNIIAGGQRWIKFTIPIGAAYNPSVSPTSVKIYKGQDFNIIIDDLYFTCSGVETIPCSSGTEPKTAFYGINVSALGDAAGDGVEPGSWDNTNKRYLYTGDYGAGKLKFYNSTCNGTNFMVLGSGAGTLEYYLTQEQINDSLAAPVTEYRPNNASGYAYMEWTNVDGGVGGAATVTLINSGQDANSSNQTLLTVNGSNIAIINNGSTPGILDALSESVYLNAGATNTIRATKITTSGNFGAPSGNFSILGFKLEHQVCAPALPNLVIAEVIPPDNTCILEDTVVTFTVVVENNGEADVEEAFTAILKIGGDSVAESAPSHKVPLIVGDTVHLSISWQVTGVAPYYYTFTVNENEYATESDYGDNTYNGGNYLSLTVTAGEAEADNYLLEYGNNTGTRIELTGASGDIQWQYSTDGNNFSDVPLDGNTAEYLTGELSENTWYRAKVSVNDGDCYAYSNVVEIEVRKPIVVYVRKPADEYIWLFDLNLVSIYYKTPNMPAYDSNDNLQEVMNAELEELFSSDCERWYKYVFPLEVQEVSYYFNDDLNSGNNSCEATATSGTPPNKHIISEYPIGDCADVGELGSAKYALIDVSEIDYSSTGITINARFPKISTDGWSWDYTLSSNLFIKVVNSLCGIGDYVQMNALCTVGDESWFTYTIHQTSASFVISPVFDGGNYVWDRTYQYNNAIEDLLLRFTEESGTERGFDYLLELPEGCDFSGILTPKTLPQDVIIYSHNRQIFVVGAERFTVYNITGQQTPNSNLLAGVYIIKIGNKAYKAVVR